MDRKTVVIKKYENRRLYDTTNSRYINQDEIAQMLRSGCDVQVVDAATGEDLTRLVLTQIIVEQAKTPDSAFPLDVLRQMVVASSRVTQQGALQYMKAFMDMYQNAYRAITPPVNPFDFAAAARPAETAPDTKLRTPQARGGESEVDELKRRVGELESLLPKRGRRKSRASKRTAGARKR